MFVNVLKNLGLVFGDLMQKQLGPYFSAKLVN
jgi:hypothetical protein